MYICTIVLIFLFPVAVLYGGLVLGNKKILMVLYGEGALFFGKKKYKKVAL